ncbi:MAG: hypothetical protein Q4B58_01240 [Bacteroidales bacterium]|nr:hypothetical protein [Bacteroidales bacterium]
MKVLLVSRAPEFSPGKVVLDSLLLQAVARQLGQDGHSAIFCRETDLSDQVLQMTDIVVSMARCEDSLICLERGGKCVINSPSAVRLALSRKAMLQVLTDAGILVPQWCAYNPLADKRVLSTSFLQTFMPCWIKGMHSKGVSQGDVLYVKDVSEASNRLLSMLKEGYSDIVITRHLSGFLVKAYVVGGQLIHWMLPQLCGYTKFGDEVHNDAPQEMWVDESLLRNLSVQIASLTHLDVFGFDAIVSSPAKMCVIDVNDAPSFSSCRHEASKAICKLINKKK